MRYKKNSEKLFNQLRNKMNQQKEYTGEIETIKIAKQKFWSQRTQ